MHSLIDFHWFSFLLVIKLIKSATTSESLQVCGSFELNGLFRVKFNALFPVILWPKVSGRPQTKEIIILLRLIILAHHEYVCLPKVW